MRLKRALSLLVLILLIAGTVTKHVAAEAAPYDLQSDEDGFLIADGVFYGYVGEEREIVVPYGVSTIADSAFYKSELVRVTLPDSVTVIGNDAFHYCWYLEGIRIPYGLEEIGERAFSDCWNLADVKIPQSVRKIGREAFYHSGIAGEIHLPEGITGVEDRCFSGTKLNKVRLPEGITRIGSEAFIGCKYLEEINIPETVEEIGREAFAFCERLEEIVLPESLSRINSMTFFCCRELQTVHLPTGVSEIGQRAFAGCGNLTDCIISNDTAEIGTAAFYGCSKLHKKEIPEGINYTPNGENAGALPAVKQLLVLPNVILVLREDGKVTPIPVEAKENCFTESFVISKQNLYEISRWKDIQEMASCNHLIIGLRRDGTVEAISKDEFSARYLKQAYSWTNVNTLVSGNRYAAGIRSDGTIVTAGAAPEGYIEEYGFFDNLAEWTDIIKLEIGVCLAGEYAAGLRSDGTMVYEGICDVGWTGPSDHIIDFASSGWMLIGLREDGSVTANGEDSEGASVLLDWTDMKQVDCGDTEAIGLRENGTILVTSEKREAIQDLVDIERIELNLETPFVAYGTNGRVYIDPIVDDEFMEEIRTWINVKQVLFSHYGTKTSFVLGLKNDGTVVSAGIDFDSLYSDAVERGIQKGF